MYMNPLLRQLTWLLQKHPKRLMAGLGVLLLGTGVTAFGIAPLAPDAAELPVREVVQTIEAEPQASKADTFTPFVLFRSDTTRRDDSITSLFKRLGVNDSDAVAFLRQDTTARTLLLGPAGKLVSVETTDRHNLQRLTARWLPSEESTIYNRLTVEQKNGVWTARLETGTPTVSVRMSSGIIRSSLFAATDDARLPDSVASQLSDLFAGDIDFRRDLRVGDRFQVVYEALEADGELLRFGRLLGAEFINQGKSYQVVWFQEPQQKGQYYNLQGESLRRAFLASPLTFSRVSSGYGMRFHPISGGRKAHLGVDFAAPTGTPVRTVGDGVVTFAGWQNGYGNVIHVQHKQGKDTVYAHLSRINVRKGERVEQGSVIGLVGSTGASTGPHLHFEYKVNDRQQDPLTIARQNEGQPVAANARKAFAQTAQAMRRSLDAAAMVAQASAD